MDTSSPSTLRLTVKRTYRQVDESIDAHDPTGAPLRKIAVAVVVDNPHAGRRVDDLGPLQQASEEIGRRVGRLLVDTVHPYAVQSYGKGAIVGLRGEQEHAAALLTTVFAEPVREAIGGGRAWISSMVKVGPPGCSIDIPLAHKDALYVRSHYDGITLAIPECPMPDEIVLIFCAATRGRIGARVGGLSAERIVGRDGLV